MTAREIATARKAAGLTQAQLAERLGVSVRTVEAWEVGRRAPCCAPMVAAIRRALRLRRRA